jgi:hypothetical protein
LLLVINLYCFSYFIDVNPWITCLLPIIDHWNILKIVNHIFMILSMVLLQRFEKSFPSLDYITKLLINVQVFILKGWMEVKMRRSRLIRISDRHTNISSSLILCSFLPHQFIDIFLQFRQSIQYNILELLTILNLLSLCVHRIV